MDSRIVGKNVARCSAAGIAALALFGAAGLTASAAPITSTGSTTANVQVTSAITLSGLASSFSLSGIPGSTVATTTPVSFKVETNNLAGYAVTVQAAAATLNPANTTTNTDTIPIGALSVRETGTTAYHPVSNVTPTTVHTQAGRSISGGDPLNNDYQVVIPFVNADTYSVALNYVATTL